MVISEAEAIKQVEIRHTRVNRIEFEKLISNFEKTVSITEDEKTSLSEDIYSFFHNAGAGHIIEGVLMKTMYQAQKNSPDVKIRSWLEKEGKEMSLSDMKDIRYWLSVTGQKLS